MLPRLGSHRLQGSLAWKQKAAECECVCRNGWIRVRNEHECHYSLTYVISPCSTVHLEKQPVFSQKRNSPHFMGPEGSIPNVQVPDNCPYPEPDQSSSAPSHILKIHFNIILPSTPWSRKWSLSFMFPHQNPLCTSPLPIACVQYPFTLASSFPPLCSTTQNLHFASTVPHLCVSHVVWPLSNGCSVKRS